MNQHSTDAQAQSKAKHIAELRNIGETNDP
mgnify:CR=1 FL=1